MDGKLKEIGNKLFKEKKHEEAIQSWLMALKECEEENLKIHQIKKLEIDDDNDTEDEDEEVVNDDSKDVFQENVEKISIEKAILNSNICAGYCGLENYGTALEYGVECTKLRPKWYKSWYRLTTVLDKLNKLDQAKTTIEKAIECFKENPEGSNYLDILEKLEHDINKKLRKSSKETSNPPGMPTGMPAGMPPNMPAGMPPNMPAGMPPNMPDGLSSMMGELMKDKDLQSKMNDEEFKEKMRKNKDNPMALFNDPEVMGLVGKLASNMNMK